MKEVHLKVNIQAPDIDELGTKNSKNVDSFFDCMLKYEMGKSPHIELVIFYKSDTQLFHKITRYSIRNEDMLVRMIPTEIVNDKDIRSVDWSEQKVLRISKGSRVYGKDNSKLTIMLDGIRVTHFLLGQWDDERKNKEAEFYLNDTAINLIDKQYNYDDLSMAFPSSGECSWVSKNEMSNKESFGEVSYISEFNFFQNELSDIKNVVIEKEPRIVFEHNNLEEQLLLKHVRAICSMYSLYMNEKIDFCFARIYTDDCMIIHIRSVQHLRKEHVYGVLGFDLGRDLSKVVSCLNVGLVISEIENVESLVDRFNSALKLTGVSRFMLFYNNLETLRNLLIESNSIDNFNFKVGKNVAMKKVREKLKELIDIITDEDQIEFENAIAGNASFIVKRTMKNQFDSLFELCEIYPDDFGIDFNELKRLRDSVFHGHKLNNEQHDVLDKVNSKLPKFVGNIMLYFMGIYIRNREVKCVATPS